MIGEKFEQQAYCEVFTDLLTLEMVPELNGLSNTRFRPYFVQFAESGRIAWEEFTSTMAGQMNALDKFDGFRGVLSKRAVRAGGSAALLWCLRSVCGEGERNAFIDSDIVYGASVLVNYFEQHATRCLARVMGRSINPNLQPAPGVARAQSSTAHVHPNRGVPGAEGPARHQERRYAGPRVPGSGRSWIHPPANPHGR